MGFSSVQLVCMLPPPALAVLIEHIGDTRMCVFITLAQINRASRRFFLSDYAWKRFDVYQVHGQHNVYTYKGYQLQGIAAHYFNWLCGLHPARRGWHVGSELLSLTSEERYDKAFNLTKLTALRGKLRFYLKRSCGLIPGHRKWYTRYPKMELNLDELYDQLYFIAFTGKLPFDKNYNGASAALDLCSLDRQVWRCWLLHPLPDERNLKVPFQRLTPLFHDKALYIKIASCVPAPCAWSYELRNLTIPHDLNPYQHDREVNLTLAQHGQFCIVADRFKRDVNFLLEALSCIPEGSSLPRRMRNPLTWLYKQNFHKAAKFVSGRPSILADFTEHICYSEEFIFACVRANPKCILYAGTLHNDWALVNAAIFVSADALQYIPKLQNTREVVELAVAKDPHTLRWASARLRNNIKLVRSCTDRDYEVLKYATYRVRLYYKVNGWLKKHCPKQDLVEMHDLDIHAR